MNVTRHEFYDALAAVWLFLMLLTGQSLPGEHWLDWALLLLAAGAMVLFGLKAAKARRQPGVT